MVLGLFGAVLCFANPVLSQTASIPKFQPAGDWTIAPTQVTGERGINDVKIPCVAMTEFDNGFVMRLSGGDQKMLAMAIDFRQDVFVKGRKYPAMITLGDGYVQQSEATAFAANTLLFNLRNLPDFYAQLAQQNTMGLSIENNNFKFSLGNLSPSLLSLEACFRGEVVETPKMDTASADVPQTDAVPYEAPNSDLPQSFDDIVQSSGYPKAPSDAPVAPYDMAAYPSAQSPSNSPSSRLDGRVSKSMDTEYQEPAPIRSAASPYNSALTPEPSAANVYAAPTATPAEWEAFAGEDVQSVLTRWANQAGYDLRWQAKNKAKLTQNVKLSGDFQTAVNQLLAQNAGTSALAARVENAGAY